MRQRRNHVAVDAVGPVVVAALDGGNGGGKVRYPEGAPDVGCVGTLRDGFNDTRRDPVVFLDLLASQSASHGVAESPQDVPPRQSSGRLKLLTTAVEMKQPFFISGGHFFLLSSSVALFRPPTFFAWSIRRPQYVYD